MNIQSLINILAISCYSLTACGMFQDSPNQALQKNDICPPIRNATTHPQHDLDKRDSLRSSSKHHSQSSSLFREIIKTKAEYCVHRIKEAKDAIAAVRGSLNITNFFYLEFATTPKRNSLIKRWFQHPQNECLNLESSEEELALVWQILQEKINVITKDLNPRLDLGLAEAAVALEIFYNTKAQFIYSLLHSHGNIQEILVITRNFIKELEEKVAFHSERSKTEFPGIFACPHQGLKEALLLCQKEIRMWNQLELKFTSSIANAYISILNAKNDYLFFGLKGIALEEIEAQEYINNIIKATKVLAETRLRLTGHHH